MPLFSSHKNTAEDWHRRLSHSTKPQEWVKPLLSDLAFPGKVKILLAMPPSTIQKRPQMRVLESKLEDAGHGQLAQIVRFFIFWGDDDDDDDDEKDTRQSALRWSQSIIEADIQARWIVQREIYVKDEARALGKSVGLCENGEKAKELSQQLMAYREELQSLDNQYWNQSRCYWRLEGDMPTGVFSKGFKTCRENPDWYLSDWLSQDCAGRGGCCGRSCGCCQGPRKTDRGWSGGHCTSACGCCMGRSPRGVDATRNDMEDFPFDVVANKTKYSGRIFRAYIWGLSFLDEQGLYGQWHRN